MIGITTSKLKIIGGAYPDTSVMVNSAIKNLKSRDGSSSTQAIKKYINKTYNIEDADELSSNINKYIKGAVASGALIRTKGRGACGSFKLPEKVPKSKSPIANQSKAVLPKKATSIRIPTPMETFHKSIRVLCTKRRSQLKKLYDDPNIKPSSLMVHLLFRKMSRKTNYKSNNVNLKLNSSNPFLAKFKKPFK